MKSLLLLLNLLSPIQENFENRLFWKVISLRESARSREDTIMVLISMKNTISGNTVTNFIKNPDNLPNEVRLAYTSLIFEIPTLDSLAIENLKILSDSIPELKDYFTLKIIQKNISSDKLQDAFNYLRLLQKQRYQKIALRNFIQRIWEMKDTLYVDSLINLPFAEDIQKQFLKAFINLARGDTMVARKIAYQLSRSSPASVWSLRLVNLLDDTLKAFVYYSNENYQEANKIFSRIKTSRYPYAQIISAYRVRDYKGTVELYEKLREKLSDKERGQLPLQIGYSYWKTDKPFKSFEYLLISANSGSEIAARLIADILIKSDSNVVNEFFRKAEVKSQQLNYSLGLYFLYTGDTAKANTYFKNSLKGSNKNLKVKSAVFLKNLGELIDDDSDGELILDYFNILNRGFVVSKEPEPDVNAEILENLKLFRYLLIFGDPQEANNFAPDKEPDLYGAVKICERLGYDNLRIRLALKLLNGSSKDGSIPEYLLRHIFPLNYYRQITQVSTFYNVKPEAIISLIREESRFDPRAVSPAGAIGLMQIMPATGRRIDRTVTADSLKIPDINLVIGTKYLSAIVDTFPNLIHALCAYNAGESRIREWVSTYKTNDQLLFMELIPFRETREYVQRIMRSIIIYRYLINNGGVK